MIGFGSTNNTNEPGSILFVNHPYPVLEGGPPAHAAARDRRGFCREPFSGDRWSTSAA